MLDVILDELEESDLRLEVAGCLGSLWAEMNYDEQDMESIPEPYRAELTREMKLKKSAEPAHPTDG